MEPNINKQNSMFNKDSNVHQLHPDRGPKITGHTQFKDVPERETMKDMIEHLYADFNLLWRKESALIRAEIREKASDVKTAAASLIGGGVVLFIGALSFAATLTILLALVMPLWAASLIVTAAFLIIGGVMLAGAKKKLEAEKLTPHRSIETLGEIKSTFQERVHEYRQH
jgi:hypothetical protein